jgi:acyl carrier protein
VTSLLGDGEGMAPAASTGSDFFDLGGRSIEAMVLAGRISTALGIRISMAGLFKASTVGDVDRRLDVMADARK